MTKNFHKKCPNFRLGQAIWAEFRPLWAVSLKNVWSHDTKSPSGDLLAKSQKHKEFLKENSKYDTMSYIGIPLKILQEVIVFISC